MKKSNIIIVLIIVLLITFIIIGVYFLIKSNQKQENNENNSVISINKSGKTNTDKTEQINNIGDKNTMSEFIIEVNNRELIVKIEDNSSSKALLEKLKDGNITINTSDYSNFEKVGELGFNLPTNDKQITTKPGDVILYQGNNICLYYNTNSWNFTKLGEVTNVNSNELKNILGDGNVILTLKLK